MGTTYDDVVVEKIVIPVPHQIAQAVVNSLMVIGQINAGRPSARNVATVYAFLQSCHFVRLQQRAGAYGQQIAE